jgi:sulfopyruvate decarboxylase TPP-binding subunit
MKARRLWIISPRRFYLRLVEPETTPTREVPMDIAADTVGLVVEEVTASERLTRLGFTMITGVPDSEFKVLIGELERSSFYVRAAREDVAIGLAAGSALAGRSALVFMESSGFGNALDALTSLVVAYRLPLVILIAWAGYRGRDVPHHNAIGEPLERIVAALDLQYQVVDLDPDLRACEAALRRARRVAEEHSMPTLVLGVPLALRDQPRDAVGAGA